MKEEGAPAVLRLDDGLGAWLPIATAPRNGDIFLAYRRGEMRDSWAMQREDGVVWNFGGSSFHERWNHAQVPTHWRPMLAPPGGGWVCSRCGTDRTKAACPNGHHAGLTGECQMVGVAQSA